MIPAMTSFVERLPELTLKGENRIKTHKHHRAPCDVCGEAMLLATKDLGHTCKMTPRCKGKHQREPMEKSA